MKLYIGIDPGASGGMAAIAEDGELVSVQKYTTDDEAVKWVESFLPWKPTVALELVGGFIAGAKLPGSSMFKLGRSFGFFQGVVMASRIPLHLVRPQKWQAGIPGLKGIKDSARKRKLKEHAIRLYPKSNATLATSDAILIADWARREGL